MLVNNNEQRQLINRMFQIKIILICFQLQLSKNDQYYKLDIKIRLNYNSLRTKLVELA